VVPILREAAPSIKPAARYGRLRMSYRGDTEASPERLAQLDARIAELEARLTDVFWERVAHHWAVARRLDERLSPLEARHARIGRLEDAIARAEHGPHADPELPPEPGPPGALTEAVQRIQESLGYYSNLFEGVEAAAESFDAEVDARRRANGGWGLRLDVEGAPVDIELNYQRQGDHTYWMGKYSTTVAPAARLTLRPEGIWQDIKEMFGFGKEIELGDPKLDPAFVIEGEERTAEVFLPVEVRGALLAIGVEAFVNVTIADGRAAITTPAVSPRATKKACRALAIWHGLPSPLPLLAD